MVDGSIMSNHLSPVISTAIKAIESLHSDYGVVVAAAHAIEAEAIINLGFLSLKKLASDEEFLSLMEEYERVDALVQEAYSTFVADPGHGRAGLLNAFSEVESFAKQFPGRTA